MSRPPSGHRHKIRTIYDGSDGGKDDGSDGAGWGTSSSLATCGSCGGTSLSGCPWPREGGRQTSTWGLAMAGAGTRWVLLKADVTKAHRRVKVLRKDCGGRMVGEQGRHIRHGQCPILLGTPGSPSTPGPLRTFPSSGLELRLCG